VCKFCPRSFSNKSNKNKHELSQHGGEALFICEYCDKGFFSKNVKREHEYTHTGEKPYKCCYCSASFGSRSNQNTHEYQHGKKNSPIVQYYHKVPGTPGTFIKSVGSQESKDIHII
jgi:KRAB domain-containing zinc finger protein